MPKITADEFNNLARFIFDAAGIQLDKGKEYLVEARLEPVLEKHGLDSFSDLYQQALTDTTGNFKSSLIDAITTNETCFFRDKSPFELLKNRIIPDFVTQNKAMDNQPKIPLKLWSTACSTGQEVYSLAITLKEFFQDNDRFDIQIMGTDISKKAIKQADDGKYSQFEIERGLPPDLLKTYFTQKDHGWQIKTEIRDMVRFSQMDLNSSFAERDIFDIILCRYVSIYFPTNRKISLFQKLAKVLNPEGSLIIGGSESLIGLTDIFIPRHFQDSVFYQLRSSESIKSTPPELSPYQQS